MLRTGRLELWRPQAGDIAGMVALVTPEETRRHLGPNRADLADQFARLLRNEGSWSLYGYGNFAIRLVGEPAIVGSCGVFHTWRGFGAGMDDVPEAGWIVATAHAGQGIASEAMRAALGWFDAEHGRQRVTCMIEEGNAASHRLAVRLGFEECGQRGSDDGRPPLTLYQRPG